MQPTFWLKLTITKQYPYWIVEAQYLACQNLVSTSLTPNPLNYTTYIQRNGADGNSVSPFGTTCTLELPKMFQ